ncbi:MAG TPA: hypothetical protein VFQ83_13925 [Candidatus Udaeobacter sp.]|jgi:hypothetical protein|nr:hypothetical protein [Candidatus Udaeobacter sp.]
MDWKKFSIAFFAAFGFIFVFGFVWYGTLMQGAHQEVPMLFRPKPDFPWLILGHIVMAFFLTLLSAKFVPAGGAGTCALLGLFVALIYVGAHLIAFAVQPITSKILWGWNIGAVVQFTVAGAIIGVIYKLISPATNRV